jgi:hypothetical protein
VPRRVVRGGSTAMGCFLGTGIDVPVLHYLVIRKRRT